MASVADAKACFDEMTCCARHPAAREARDRATAYPLPTTRPMPLAPRHPAPSIVLAVVATLVILFCASRADAQTINVVNEASLPRLDAQGNPTKKRRLELEPEAINRQDCLEDQRIRFTLQLDDFEANATLAAWASLDGEDCAAQGSRDGESARCWPIVDAIPLQLVVDVDVPVRKILSAAPPFAPTRPAPDDTACGTVDLSTVSVQFLYFRPGERATAAVQKAIDVVADTVGPHPPADLKVLPGDRKLQVSWEMPPTVSRITGARAYCERASGESCSGVELRAGRDLPPDEARRLECGRIAGAQGTTLLAGMEGTPLENGASVAVAVAHVDAFDNVGPLSNLSCSTPIELPAEEQESSCRAASVGRAGGTADWAAVVAVALLVSARFRRRRASSDGVTREA